MCNASSQVRVPNAPGAVIPRVFVHCLHPGNSGTNTAILGNGNIVHRFGELGEIVIPVPYVNRDGNNTEINNIMLE